MALLPPDASPLTVTFQPAAAPVASVTPKFDMVVLVVCAAPVSVTPVSVGTSGAVAKVSDPGVTLNWVRSLAVAARAGAAEKAAATQAAAKLVRRRVRFIVGAVLWAGSAPMALRRSCLVVFIGTQSGDLSTFFRPNAYLRASAARARASEEQRNGAAVDRPRCAG